MNFNTFKENLLQIKDDSIAVQLPNGSFIPAHFHLTEISQVSKNIVDCGGTLRKENTIVLQLWVASDTKHRLSPEKVLTIIAQSNAVLIDPNATVEIEYQTDTIGRYGVYFSENKFVLSPLFTACPAPDLCGIPAIKSKLKLSEIGTTNSCCSADAYFC